MQAEINEENNESYLIFSVQNQLFSLKNLNVQEIMHSAKIHPLPFVPPYIEGVVNCRGLAYTVVNLLKLENIENKNLENSPVLVFRRKDDQFAIQISSIELFFEPDKEDILPEGIRYKSKLIPYFDVDAIEATLKHDLREEDL
ncbi:MAG: chemotaxis protein CheW [Treponema sp.]|nr:chemotaxis protein CheW [Treponema sp.]